MTKYTKTEYWYNAIFGITYEILVLCTSIQVVEIVD